MGMHTKQYLLRQLKEIGVEPSGTLMAHLSYKAIGEVEGRGDAVLDTLMEYMQPGLLVLPSHTWDNVGVSNPVMDVLYTPTCVGLLTEIFRKRLGVYRSLHPTHSVAAFGAEAEEFVSGEEHIGTPCGEGGVYYNLWQRDAQILLIGVNFTRNTFIHGIEEWDGAEGSISEEKTDLYVINHKGRRLYTPQHRHCSALGSESFSKLEPQAQQQGILTLGRYGNATTRLMGAKPLREMVAPLLKEDPGYLLRY
jgi:aminoglycoside 3-N-acetyltransferase